MNIHKILPVFAIAAGLAPAAVTSAFKNMHHTDDDPYTFIYQPPATDPDPYSADNVQTLSNWVYSDAADSCSGSQRACSITAPSDYVDDSGTEPVLSSSIDIHTQTNLAGEARVSQVATGASFTNKN